MYPCQQPLILASTSLRRQTLLRQVGLSFEVMPSNYTEGPPQGRADVFAAVTAERKAREVFGRIKLTKGLLLAADTVVTLDDRLFGKPQDQDEAKAMLTQLQGRDHTVFTGVFIINSASSQLVKFTEQTQVTMRSLTDAEIRAYVATEAWQGKAGGYGIQDYAAGFVTKIDGCYYNVVGLPIARVILSCQQLGLFGC